MNVELTFRMKPARSRSLIMGELSISGLGPNRIVYDATSGIAGCQKRSDMWVRGKGLIPPSDCVIAPYTVETTPINPTNPAAAGEWQYRIFPDEVWAKDREIVQSRRTLLRIHFDANHATSPGSAGCVVLTNNGQWESFMDHMRLVRNAINAEIVPLEVLYA